MYWREHIWIFFISLLQFLISGILNPANTFSWMKLKFELLCWWQMWMFRGWPNFLIESLLASLFLGTEECALLRCCMWLVQYINCICQICKPLVMTLIVSLYFFFCYIGTEFMGYKFRTFKLMVCWFGFVSLERFAKLVLTWLAVWKWSCIWDKNVDCWSWSQIP